MPWIDAGASRGPSPCARSAVTAGQDGAEAGHAVSCWRASLSRSAGCSPSLRPGSPGVAVSSGLLIADLSRCTRWGCWMRRRAGWPLARRWSCAQRLVDGSLDPQSAAGQRRSGRSGEAVGSLAHAYFSAAARSSAPAQIASGSMPGPTKMAIGYPSAGSRPVTRGAALTPRHRNRSDTAGPGPPG